MLQKMFPDEFNLDIRLTTPVLDSDLQNCDILHFHRKINDPEKTLEWINKFKAAGVVVVCDVDDYWRPFGGHPAEYIVRSKKVDQQIVEAIINSSWISTTTNIYKQHILKHNKNVIILPNAIDPTLEHWKNKTKPSDRIRIGWIGGSSHERDLNRIKGTFNLLLNDKEINNKIQIVMCGYDTRGSITEINPITKEEVTRPITSGESIWNKFEAIFNDNNHAAKEQYVRRNTLPITRYGEHYNYVDVCLAPLDQHTFNECKSELKVIETGMMHKALIASDLYVYKELLTHGVNAMLVDPKKDHKLWYKYIKELILNNELRESLADNLHSFVNPKYTLQEVTKTRAQFYRDVYKAKESV